MSAPAVELAAVSLQYESIVALNNVSLVIGKGEKVALVGPSGAGKSSLIKVLAGQVPLTSGRVHVLGNELASLRGRRLRGARRRIGTISQGLDLAPSLRVVHNVNAARLGEWNALTALASLVRPRGADDVRQVLRQVDLEDRILARTGELSGGQRQRVAIARVLLQDPELVLADEPTSSVDPKLATAMMRLLCTGNQTLVVSAHDPQLARSHVDRMIGMRDATVVFDRPASTVSDTDLIGFYDQ